MWECCVLWRCTDGFLCDSLPPPVSLCVSVLESPWLFTWIRFDALVHCSPEQNKRRPTSPLHPQKVTCVATMSEQVETRRKRRERPGTAPAWPYQNGIFKNENSENESIEDKVVHLNPCTAATTQLDHNISAIGQLARDQNISRWWKYDANLLLTCRWSSKAPNYKRIQCKWVKPSDGDVYMSLWGLNTA